MERRRRILSFEKGKTQHNTYQNQTEQKCYSENTMHDVKIQNVYTEKTKIILTFKMPIIL